MPECPRCLIALRNVPKGARRGRLLCVACREDDEAERGGKGPVQCEHCQRRFRNVKQLLLHLCAKETCWACDDPAHPPCRCPKLKELGGNALRFCTRWSDPAARQLLDRCERACDGKGDHSLAVRVAQQVHQTRELTLGEKNATTVAAGARVLRQVVLSGAKVDPWFAMDVARGCQEALGPHSYTTQRVSLACVEAVAGSTTVPLNSNVMPVVAACEEVARGVVAQQHLAVAILMAVARIHLRAGDHARAVGLAREAVERARLGFGPDSTELADAQAVLVVVEEAAGCPGEAAARCAEMADKRNAIRRPQAGMAMLAAGLRASCALADASGAPRGEQALAFFSELQLDLRTFCTITEEVPQAARPEDSPFALTMLCALRGCCTLDPAAFIDAISSVIHLLLRAGEVDEAFRLGVEMDDMGRKLLDSAEYPSFTRRLHHRKMLEIFGSCSSGGECIRRAVEAGLRYMHCCREQLGDCHVETLLALYRFAVFLCRASMHGMAMPIAEEVAAKAAAPDFVASFGPMVATDSGLLVVVLRREQGSPDEEAARRLYLGRQGMDLEQRTAVEQEVGKTLLAAGKKEEAEKILRAHMGYLKKNGGGVKDVWRQDAQDLLDRARA